MKTCKTDMQHPDGRVKPCGNRVISFVDPQPKDQCYRCYLQTEAVREPPHDAGHGYQDRNDGGVPK